MQTNQLERAARSYGDINNYHKSNICSFALESIANAHSDHVVTCRKPDGAVKWELQMMTGGTQAISCKCMSNLACRTRYQACLVIFRWCVGCGLYIVGHTALDHNVKFQIV